MSYQANICGAMSHVCIDTTTRAAFDLGYKSVVISEACATKNLSFNSHTVSAEQVQIAYVVELHGIFVDVTNTNTLAS